MKICSQCGAEMNEGAGYCKKCGGGISAGGAGLGEKKARVLEREKRGAKTAALIAGLLFTVLSVWVFFAIYSGKTSLTSQKTASAHAGAAAAEAATQENGEVRIPLSDLDDKAAHFYVYQAGGRDIRFFLLRDAEGGVRAALDACHNCYRAKRGYRQEGNTVICNNCGMSFRYENIGIITGGCNPIPLPRKIVGQVVVLKTKDIEAGAKYF